MQNTNDQLLTALKKADSVLLEIFQSLVTGKYNERASYHKSIIETVRNDHHSLICPLCREKNRVNAPTEQESGEVELHGSPQMIQFILDCISVNDALSTALPCFHGISGPESAILILPYRSIQIARLKVISHGAVLGSPQLRRKATLFMEALIGNSAKPQF